MNARAAASAHAAGMAYGVDIPFWWQSIDDETQAAIGVVTFRGERKAASYHCVDLVDNIGIMDFRNVAAGSDGMIAHAADLLAYADRVNRARVYVGVETARSEAAPYVFLAGISRSAFRNAIFGRTSSDPALKRTDLSIISDGASVHVGVKGTNAAPLIGLARRFKVDSTDARAVDSAVAALRNDGEWGEIEPRSIGDGSTGASYPGVRAKRVMLAKLTFAGKTVDEMEVELSKAEVQFAAHSSYEGIAIHHYDSYRALPPSKR